MWSRFALCVVASLLVQLSAMAESGSHREDGPGPKVLNSEFVAKFRDAISRKDAKALEMAPEESIATQPAAYELRLLAAEAFAHAGNSLAAQMITMDVASRVPGTSQGAWALAALDQLAQSSDLDESALEDMAYEFEGSVSRPSEKAMLAWYRSRAYARRGFETWATKALTLVGKDTRWYADRLFDEATDALVDDNADAANTFYAEILKSKSVRAPTREMTALNRARLVFERGNYAESVNIARTLDLPLRERARALIEMAWSRFYLKQYGKALGILKVVDSAFFESLRSPEADLLRMLIGRELCRYDLMKKTATEFRERYAKTFKHIDSRRRLDRDEQLKQMALQTRHLQKRATLIHRYRTERRSFAEDDLAISKGLREFLLRSFAVRERRLEAEIARSLPREIEDVASQLVDLRQQISVLEAAALNKPTSARVIDDVDYGFESTSYTKFDQTYWPVDNESWWDELDAYQVLMQPHCADETTPAKESDANE